MSVGTEVYTPDPRLSFEPETHTYRLGGQVVPSVTTVLDRTLPKDHLLKWYATQGWEGSRQKLAEAAQHGTRMHRLFEKLCWRRSLEIEDVDGLEPWVEPLQRWLDRHVQTVFAVEFPLVNEVKPGIAYAGTGDLLAYAQTTARIELDLTVVDLKTTDRDEHSFSFPKKSWRLQLAAYAACPQIQAEVYPFQRCVLHAPRDHPGELYAYWFRPQQQRDDEIGFLECLRFYRWLEAYKP